jgi:ATP-dependent helicase/nuclease subunit B
MDPFLEQLKALCAAHPTRTKWVFVPTHAIGRTVADRLVLEGTDWANLRFVTPLDVALRMGAPFLVERGIDPSEEGLGPALIMRLLLGLPSGPSYFRRLATQPAMAQALWTTIRELRMAGIKAADIASEAFTSKDKHAEFQALVAAYESFLTTNARGDWATVYEEALGHSDWCPIQPQDCWTELPDVYWTPLQRTLIDAMPGERIVPATTALPGVSTPRRLRDAAVCRTKTSEPDTRSCLAFLMSPELATSPSGLHLFHAGGSEAEIEEVFRRILASGQPLDDVEIACASETYSTLIWDKACRYAWPVTLASGLPATLTRPGRALVALTTWIEADFAAGGLRRLLQSGDVTLDARRRNSGSEGGSAPTLTPGRAARLLAKAEAAWGRDTYRLALGRLSKSYRAYAAREDHADDERAAIIAKADQVDQLLVWITDLLASIPAPGADRRVDLQQLVESALAFVKHQTSTGSALDGAAAAALENSLGDLRALGEFRCSLLEGLRFIRERVDGLRVGADRPRPGHLHVSSLTQAAFAGRRNLFVVGLEEGGVFPASFEDPVLLDSERERISPALRRSGDRIDEAVFAVLSRLAAAGASPDRQICLSYSSRDLREFRRTYPSWLMLQAHRLVTGLPNDSYDDLEKALGTPKSCVPESPSKALSDSGWWLNGVVQAGDAAKDAVLEEYPDLAEGVRAAEERASDRFTAYDGYVPAAGAVLDPCAANIVVSPTQLESAAKCPFKHFIERGLRVRAMEDDDRDTDLWLDPATRGNQLHDLYAQLLRRCRADGRRPKLPQDRDWLRDQARAALDRLYVEMPPPSDEVYEREMQGFLDDVDLFVEEEANSTDARSPVGLEVSFGKGDDQGEPLAQSEPIVIDLGNGLRFRLAGRIDRIDQIGPSSFEIIDYKTGGYWEKDYEGRFNGGRLLQHALYGLAAVELLRRKHKRATVTQGTYYFSSKKGGKTRLPKPTPSVADVTEVLSDLRDVIASGLFVHATDESGCKFCHLGPACGMSTVVKQAEAKLQDPRLAPFVKLVAHE